MGHPPKSCGKFGGYNPLGFRKLIRVFLQFDFCVPMAVPFQKCGCFESACALLVGLFALLLMVHMRKEVMVAMCRLRVSVHLSDEFSS
eukprot:5932086-Amphidinium_carterae.1